MQQDASRRRGPIDSAADQGAATLALARRHLRVGWWSLVVFAVMGISLESLHGFKIGWYLDTGNETRRLLLTLAHAHGVLLSLVNLAFAASLRTAPDLALQLWRFTSPCLLLASALMPAGFLLGGLVIYDGDPGLGIFLLPVGAASLVAGLVATARAATRAGAGPGSES